MIWKAKPKPLSKMPIKKTFTYQKVKVVFRDKFFWVGDILRCNTEHEAKVCISSGAWAEFYRLAAKGGGTANIDNTYNKEMDELFGKSNPFENGN